jgi:hypothetical protein
MLFTSFFLEPEYDWLEIFDGPTTSPSVSIGRFTGQELVGQLVNSTSGTGSLRLAVVSSSSHRAALWGLGNAPLVTCFLTRPFFRFTAVVTLTFMSDNANPSNTIAPPTGFTFEISEACPAGRFSATGTPNVGPTWGACPGVCGPASPGYHCNAGATDASGSPCPPGRYSTGGAVRCALCPQGRYGSEWGTPYNTCSGPCVASASAWCGLGAVSPGGKYCPWTTGTATSQSTFSSACTDSCPAGWACPGDVPQYQCSPGQYSIASSPVCLPCPAGKYGASSGQSSSACSGACSAPAGSACMAGSTSAVGTVCPAGRYKSTAGATSCTLCNVGKWGGTANGTSAGACGGTCLAQPGWACLAGSSSSFGTQCPPGTYSLQAATVCTACPAGTFGSSASMTWPACSGNCSAGYACPAGSTNATAVRCSVGTYSLGGAGVCSACPPGFTCAGGPAAPVQCSLLGMYAAPGVGNCYMCPPGVYAATTALTSAACSGNCTAGYACPSGSTSPMAITCQPGQYSLAGASQCTPCPAGVFGATAALSSAACSGNCTAGYACGAGSVSSMALGCTPGKYSLSGAGVCSMCPQGVYGDADLLTSPACTAPCPAGTYGGSAGLTSAACSGNCTAGYACPAGSSNSTATPCPSGAYSLAGAGQCTLCPGGRYGAVMTMTTASCSGTCAPGYACPPGSTNATAVPCAPGTYSTGGLGACVQCGVGLYGTTSSLTSGTCSGPCPAGLYGASPGMATSGCSGPCAAGYFCPEGSSNATAAPCVPGSFCLAGSSSPVLCLPGVYGSTYRLQSPLCTGSCPAGFYCPGRCRCR